VSLGTWAFYRSKSWELFFLNDLKIYINIYLKIFRIYFLYREDSLWQFQVGLHYTLVRLPHHLSPFDPFLLRILYSVFFSCQWRLEWKGEIQEYRGSHERVVKWLVVDGEGRELLKISNSLVWKPIFMKPKLPYVFKFGISGRYCMFGNFPFIIIFFS
jgi:hypothetical protein